MQAGTKGKTPLEAQTTKCLFVRQSNYFQWPADPHKYSLTNFETIESELVHIYLP